LPARSALLARTAPAAPKLIVTCRARATSHEQGSREPRLLPLPRRFCHEWSRQESRSARLARRRSRDCSIRKVWRSHCLASVAVRAAHGARVAQLERCREEGPPNSAAAPDARPFVGPRLTPLVRATPCVALLGSWGGAPGEQQAVGRTIPEISSLENRTNQIYTVIVSATTRRHERTRSIVANSLLAQANALRRGSCREQRVSSVRGDARRDLRSSQSIHGVSRHGGRSWRARPQQRPSSWSSVGHVPRHTSSAAESRVLCRWHGASTMS